MGPNTSADATVDVQATVVRSFLEGKTHTEQKRFMEGLDVVIRQVWKQPSVAPPSVAEAKAEDSQSENPDSEDAESEVRTSDAEEE